MSSEIRTRFAPSPTGYIHIGNIRTALFAWLLAKHANGQFILRIEDTDKKREVIGSIEHIINCLQSLGLDYDEGPDKPGEYGPYLQSERLDIYLKWANALIKKGRAYSDPYTPAELNSLREKSIKQHRPFLYRDYRPKTFTSWDGTTPLRFKFDPQDYQWHDEIMGNLSAGKEAVDDFILIKSDGFPTYNFAHIIDDYEMKISHVIRGNEFIASVPNYLNLYEALEIKRPLLATPPPVLGPSGNKKLSKRDGAKDILEYLKEGYLESALVNFIASLGWNDGTTQEIYSKQELIKSFSLSRVQKSGARFDDRRLLWMNGSYIRNLPLKDLAQKASAFWPLEAQAYDQDYKNKVLALIQERLKYLAELPDLSRFFFVDLPVNINLITNNKKLNALGDDQLKSLLTKTISSLDSCDFSLSELNTILNQLLESTKQPPAILFSLIRIASTQAPSSPPLAESLVLIGKERTLQRLNQQLNNL